MVWHSNFRSSLRLCVSCYMYGSMSVNSTFPLPPPPTPPKAAVPQPSELLEQSDVEHPCEDAPPPLKWENIMTMKERKFLGRSHLPSLPHKGVETLTTRKYLRKSHNFFISQHFSRHLATTRTFSLHKIYQYTCCFFFWGGAKAKAEGAQPRVFLLPFSPSQQPRAGRAEPPAQRRAGRGDA